MARMAWAGVAAVLLSALSLPTDAANLRLKLVSRTTSFGGPGGSDYEVSCPFGTVMTGLSYREGSWVDALAPICSRYDIGAKRFVEVSVQPAVGGHGGGPGALRCEQPRGVVTHLYVTQAQNEDKSVGSIAVACGDYLDPSQHANVGYSGKDDDDYVIGRGGMGSGTIECPPPLVAGGIFGKAGVFIDRVGLSCVDYQPRGFVVSPAVKRAVHIFPENGKR